MQTVFTAYILNITSLRIKPHLPKFQLPVSIINFLIIHFLNASIREIRPYLTGETKRSCITGFLFCRFLVDLIFTDVFWLQSSNPSFLSVTIFELATEKVT